MYPNEAFPSNVAPAFAAPAFAAPAYYPCHSNWFALIVVLFILLIIIGAVCYSK
ncbi:uncharacterized protein (TIGR01732 family) [Bacillus oleivorans]|uniref:Uncharacterized protein (TIGR01732 family) n=1 Tax=Bacillus oleivorans TaxID=1448271 RepID=A0A285CL76_9BACI|nr:YjcZ family sporulation protein [Bacillus oleivorans]SNX68314.1 uncharacterized protein (TIGR01732 family) [Bacillus oleivorans]